MKVSEKVELGFNENAGGNFFVLDDPVRGVLDNITYGLGGAAYYDVTQWVKAVTVNRGRSRELDRFNAGTISVTFDNTARIFDPTFAASPFYGQVVPRRDIRYTANNIVQFTGTTDDWNLDYQLNGQSESEVVGYDGFALLSQQTLTPQTYTSQKSGARITAILNDANVNWSYSNRAIDVGQETLQGDTVAANTNVVSYINIIEKTELGEFFFDKKNFAVWHDRSSIAATTAGVTVFADDGSGIAYSSVKVVYGSELLFNKVIYSRAGGGTATAYDSASITSYGTRVLTESGLLHTSDTATATLAAYVVTQYRNPEYRFELIEVEVNNLTLADQNKVLALEIGNVAKIVYTPNKIPPAIVKYAEIVGISTSTNAVSHKLTFKFRTLDNNTFVLDDAVFGVLDYNNLGY